MISISRPFPGEIRVSIAIPFVRIRIDLLPWLWTKSLVAIHRPIGSELIVSIRTLWIQISLWRRSSESLVRIFARLAHDLREMATATEDRVPNLDDAPICEICRKSIRPGELVRVRMDGDRYTFECRLDGCPRRSE